MFEEGLIMSAPTLWFLLGFVFFAAELFLPGFIMVFFGVGAWAAALAAGLGADLALALIIFIGMSDGSLLLLRRMLVATFQGRSRLASERESEAMEDAGDPDDETTPFMLTGKQATVSRTITPKTIGEVTVGGSFWRAISDADIPEGSLVVILGHDKDNELLLRVRKM